MDLNNTSSLQSSEILKENSREGRTKAFLATSLPPKMNQKDMCPDVYARNGSYSSAYKSLSHSHPETHTHTHTLMYFLNNKHRKKNF